MFGGTAACGVTDGEIVYAEITTVMHFQKDVMTLGFSVAASLLALTHLKDNR